MLKTERLQLVPLDQAQLQDYLQNNGALEKSLQVGFRERSVSERVKAALLRKIIPAVADSTKNYLFSTFWAIINPEENSIVGEICFKGKPNERGEVEMGYGTYSEFQNMGYMTEAVGEIVKWALAQNDVKTVLAETDPTNLASHRILKKNNFIRYSQTGNNISWRKDKI
ncbi:GNAT family N-acetyltransferase [Adhaeribacter soli]|uniref:GNAT family N-acetyltransferase n=1 Tax=Adhaeribacter soli TaxID=2607655 RepID=UPI001784CED6|nr:GNAT family N-acetyltransferase [Adhaeribacter soli]